jgi:uncharacterized FAD-dependent dehydrogenase
MKEFEIAFPISKVITEQDLIPQAAKVLGIQPKMVGRAVVIRRSLDARGKDILFRYKVEATRKDELPTERYVGFQERNVASSKEVIIVGAGPAGVFAALKLIELGLKPIILERGKDVHERKKDLVAVNRFGQVDPDSNYCFGEGGAGTYSDGKLYTRSVKRGNVYEVLSRLVDAGADNSIMIDAHPHLGTDRLSGIMENIRKRIIDCGGEYHFNTRVEDIITEGGKVKGVVVADGRKFLSDRVILATGHSARDIYRLFARKEWHLEVKGFALGVRVEHPQSLINQVQYHGKYQPYMPAAEYSLVAQIENRGVFSFCMCPGGILVPAATEQGQTVLNGMSNSARNSKWANSGIVVSIEPGDFPEFEKHGVLSLMEFQASMEELMFNFASDGLKAPSQRVTDFLKNRLSTSLPATSYNPGVIKAPLHELLPSHIASRMKQAFYIFDKKMKGFVSEDAMMLGVESRTSSPVRITRDSETMEHLSIKGLVPCGEGAGYAGGIVSSAIDGINAALSVSII